MVANLGEEELKVFIDAVSTYFNKLTREPAVIRASYLSEGTTPSLGYTGLITISEKYRGSVSFTAPRGMLVGLLVSMKENDFSEENLLDTVGEVTNTIAGNARRHFGHEMEISVPVALKGTLGDIKTMVRTRPFVIALEWRSFEAAVVVDVEKS